ncbi:NRDE family protein [Denitratisoma oestradiolicum]|uniref:NRDE family protein n=1 Tax=Denitratisoma oestradiolicum TaxID=311182 RepID=A0A6S6XVJ0_9PROT|nr:NRDE family protein [Denitratisoma oestradiolicum]TWO81990.1 hypothetical protein CBW56_00685 [Denitratisoma oestradiolicum]CAB1368902.1 conserved protein of unknown function [Denitratisoma oestradiolicum]
MCLILVAWHAHPDFPLVVAANRDEFHDRPSAPADYWPGHPDLLAGRDLRGGGTWLGITRGGRFAALTNFRGSEHLKPDGPSRGGLVTGFLTDSRTPDVYLDAVTPEASCYSGFNLLVSDGKTLGWLGNVGMHRRLLPPGIYGLSNALLDTPWPKVEQSKSALAAALHALPDCHPLFDLLRDDRTYSEEQLPRTGVDIAFEQLLSAAFVRSPVYGTRNSTVLIEDIRGKRLFLEQTWSPDGEPTKWRQFELSPIH